MISATGGSAAWGAEGQTPEPLTTAEVPARTGLRTLGASASRAWWLSRGVGPYLLVADVVAYTVASAITDAGSASAHGLALVLLLLVFWHWGLYRSRLTLSLIDDLPYVLAAVTVVSLFEFALLSLAPRSDAPAWQLSHLGAILGAIVLARLIAYRVVHLARCRGLVRHSAVVVGAGQIGVRVARTLIEHRNYGLEPIGFLDADVPHRTRGSLPVPLLGGYDRLPQVIQERAVGALIVAYGGMDEEQLVDILRTCDRLGVVVFVVPRLFDLHHVTRYTDEIWGIPLVRRRRSIYRLWRAKRLVDIVLSALMLAVLTPVMVACAIAVRLEGGPGIIFRQERVGLDGRPFQVLKFRSLRPVDETESATNWNIKHDDRLGPIGKFLRASSLDELPQLWNIVRGDMSLVGPRPERPYFVDEFTQKFPRYMARHRVPAGLTGTAQVHGLRGDTSIADRARFDNYYIENWSLWEDVKILLRTVSQVLGAAGR